MQSEIERRNFLDIIRGCMQKQSAVFLYVAQYRNAIDSLIARYISRNIQKLYKPRYKRPIRGDKYSIIFKLLH
jgi:hypothetical protein